METVFCECKKCDAPIGRFVNLWTRIGKSYFSPVVEPEDDLAVHGRGEVRIGGKGTLVEECHLQDIVCSNCTALLGLRCIQTPVNHVLDENQLLLRLASVELLDNDGQEIEFAIKRVLSVNEPSKLNKPKFPDPAQGAGFTSAFSGAVELQQMQIDLHTQREDIKRIDSNGFKIVSALDKRADRAEGEVTKLKGIVGSVQSDIGCLQQELTSVKGDLGEVRKFAQDTTALAGLEDRLASAVTTIDKVGEQVTELDARFQKEMGELRSELRQQQQSIEALRNEVKDSVFAEDYARDMTNLRADMALLRQEMDQARAHGVGRVETAFPPRELEVLTSNIAKIGNRASQVETLQMEFEILKGRVERAEASRQAVDDRRQARTTDPGGPPGYSDMFPGTRKRDPSPGLEPNPKRPASSLGYSDLSDRRYATPYAWPGGLPTTNRQETPGSDGVQTANSAKRGRRSPQNRATGTSDGVTPRLRKR